MRLAVTWPVPKRGRGTGTSLCRARLARLFILERLARQLQLWGNPTPGRTHGGVAGRSRDLKHCDFPWQSALALPLMEKCHGQLHKSYLVCCTVGPKFQPRVKTSAPATRRTAPKRQARLHLRRLPVATGSKTTTNPRPKAPPKSAHNFQAAIFKGLRFGKETVEAAFASFEKWPLKAVLNRV